MLFIYVEINVLIIPKFFQWFQGKRIWLKKMPAGITTMELLDYKLKNIQAVLVALTNCEVHVYMNQNLVDVIRTEDVVSAMKFGKFGRESESLVMITQGEKEENKCTSFHKLRSIPVRRRHPTSPLFFLIYIGFRFAAESVLKLLLLLLRCWNFSSHPILLHSSHDMYRCKHSALHPCQYVFDLVKLPWQHQNHFHLLTIGPWAFAVFPLLPRGTVFRSIFVIPASVFPVIGRNWKPTYLILSLDWLVSLFN